MFEMQDSSTQQQQGRPTKRSTDTYQIRRFNLSKIDDSNCECTIKKEDVIREWGLIAENGYYQLPSGWKFTTGNAASGYQTYHITDNRGNTRGAIRFARLNSRGVLLGLFMVHPRFSVTQSKSGNRHFYIHDRKRHVSTTDTQHHSEKFVVEMWLNHHYPEWKNAFSYWE